jgi:hypothetical protein
VVGIAHGDETGSQVQRLLDGLFHRPVGDRLAQPTPGVNQRRGGSFSHHLHVGPGDHHAVPQAVDVPPQQHAGRDAGVLFRDAHLFKHPHTEILQYICSNSLLFFWHRFLRLIV